MSTTVLQPPQAHVLPNPGPIAVRAALDAIKNIGVTEDGPPYRNRGKYVDTYQRACHLPLSDHGEGFPWCSCFVLHRQLSAATELGLHLPADLPPARELAAAARWASWAQHKGLWIAHGTGIPKRGDLCCFDISSEGGIHHVGIVYSADEHGMVSIEGNTRPDGSAVRDGFCVALRHRSLDSVGAGGGFVRLPF